MILNYIYINVFIEIKSLFSCSDNKKQCFNSAAYDSIIVVSANKMGLETIF